MNSYKVNKSVIAKKIHENLVRAINNQEIVFAVNQEWFDNCWITTQNYAEKYLMTFLQKTEYH